MTPLWAHLDELDRAKFQTVISFLRGRMTEVATLKWALNLRYNQNVERLAVIDVLHRPRDQSLEEPWNKAWRLVEEAWRDSRDDGDHDLSVYDVQRRLQSGDRSGSLLIQIVNLVRPRLKIAHARDYPWGPKRKSDRRSRPVDNLRAELDSGKLVKLDLLALETINEDSFLIELANMLDAALVRGLDVARRTGCYPGILSRVYYTAGGEDDGDPDAFHEGIAPCVKLLHAVVERIAELNQDAAKLIISNWQRRNSPVHQRLWAAMARDSVLVPSESIATLINGMDNDEFWNIDGLPEIIELRARRFEELDERSQSTVLKRICKGPPRSSWYRPPRGEDLKTARKFWSARELKRLILAGVALSSELNRTFDDWQNEFPELNDMTAKDGFPEGVRVRHRVASPDLRYDDLAGQQRLKALEEALNSERGSWENDPGERAGDWIRQPGNSTLLLCDFESLADGGDAYPLVWGRFAWAHVSGEGQSERIMHLIEKLSDKSVLSAIDAITHWFSGQDKTAVGSEIGLQIWHRLWLLAVNITNSTVTEPAEQSFDTALQEGEDDTKLSRLDTLNNPAGRLVGSFLGQCPSLELDHNGQWPDGPARDMRDAIMAVGGQSKLIARHRLIGNVGYFLKADPMWAMQELLAPLRADNHDAMILWQAVASRTLRKASLEQIGNDVINRISDSRLPRRTRQSLMFSLTVELMHAFREKRDPAVSCVAVQQLLRNVEEHLRAHAAKSVYRFVKDVSGTNPPAAIFISSAKPFLTQVWPQERSLTSGSVSAAFADLPAASGEAFVDAVKVIARFLVPFDCWSMLDYGLHGKNELASIDTAGKAAALLEMLDLTVGQAQSSVIPHDLSDALAQIESVSPALQSDQRFRRLATAARR